MSEPNPLPADSGACAPIFARPGCFVVDDDAGICKALAFTLKKLGFDAAEIPSPEALKTALASTSPDLVFLDLGLGTAGATDVLPILAAHGYSGPVQLMSGRSQAVLDEVVAFGEEHGLRMLPALVKPFRMGVVKELVASLGFAAPAAGPPH